MDVLVGVGLRNLKLNPLLPDGNMCTDCRKHELYVRPDDCSLPDLAILLRAVNIYK
jgi:hypothetical protein